MKKSIDAVTTTNTEVTHSKENAVKSPAHRPKPAKTTPATSEETAMKKPANRSKTAKTTPATSEENAMKKPAKQSKTTTVLPASESGAPTLSPSIANPPAATPPASPASIALVYLASPPANAVIPTPPSGAATPNGANYRSVVPRSIELAALPGAVTDLQRFGTFASVFGVAGLAYAQVLQAFVVASQWSTMRKASSIWDGYSQSQEGIAWGNARLLMDRMGPLFEIATVGDPTLPSTFPSLATILGAKKAIAQKAAGIRKLNREAVARGELPTHGEVGKRRAKAAMKALAASAKGSGGATTPATATTSPTTAPAAVSATPASGTGTSGSGH